MNHILYNLVIWGYHALALLLSPFNKKARLFTNGRKNLLIKLEKAFQGNTKPVFWLHAASLGEFEQGRPVMERVRLQFPNYRILLTFYSPSGYEVRKNYQGADDVFYLPKDTKKNVKQFFEIVNPEIGVLVKYEFWYHLIMEAIRRNTHMISISTVLRPNHMIFKQFNEPLREIFRKFDHFFVQDQDTLDLLKTIEVNQVEITGDTRYDRVSQIVEDAGEIPLVDEFLSSKECLIVGSCWPGDMDKLYPLINGQELKLKYVIAPHNIKENEIQTIINLIHKPTIRFSQIQNQENLSSFEVLIIDNMGMLSSLYKYGKYAYIGGAFRGALHNTLEAAVYGIPIIFGKHVNNKKFNEATQLVARKAAFEIENEEELKNTLLMLEKDQLVRKKAMSESFSQVKEQLGATDSIMKFLSKSILK